MTNPKAWHPTGNELRDAWVDGVERTHPDGGRVMRPYDADVIEKCVTVGEVHHLRERLEQHEACIIAALELRASGANAMSAAKRLGKSRDDAWWVRRVWATARLGNMSTRAGNVLRINFGVDPANEAAVKLRLAEMVCQDVLATKNAGRKTLRELQEWMAERGSAMACGCRRPACNARKERP